MRDVHQTETRAYTPDELAFLITTFRQTHGWSQEVLAELAGVTPRTVQRVEAAQPSSLDTRRALARAFRLEDIDTFSRSRAMTTPEGAVQAKADFDRRYVVLEFEPMDGRAIIASVAASGPYRAIQTGAIGRPPREVEDLFAEGMDFLEEIVDVADVAGHGQLLAYADQLETTFARMRALGWEPAYGARAAAVTQARLPTTLSYIMSVPVGGGSRHVAVERSDT